MSKLSNTWSIEPWTRGLTFRVRPKAAASRHTPKNERCRERNRVETYDAIAFCHGDGTALISDSRSALRASFEEIGFSEVERLIHRG
jgi:hypothetical protein